MRSLYAALRNFLLRSRLDADEGAEIESYIALLADELVASGVSRSRAERAARAQSGGRTQLHQSVRDLRTGIQLVVLWQDVRFALRQICRRPLFAAAALGSLALGMGATTAIFSAVSSLALYPLPLENADRLVFLSQIFRNGLHSPLFAPDFMAMRSGSLHAFDQVAGFVERADVDLTGSGLPERLRCVGITANWLSTLGVHPQLGRGFLETEDHPGGAPLVLITDRLWRTHFGSDPALIGRAIILSGRQQTVLGILPRDFAFPDPSLEPDIFVPAVLPAATVFTGGPVSPVDAIARLRPSITLTRARAEVKSFSTARARLYPAGWAQLEISVESLQTHISGNMRRPLLLLLGCVVCVLMLTCANVGNLQLARAAARTQEFSIRKALGARRTRLIQQFLTENLVLTALASFLGLALAWASLAFIRHSGFLTGTPIETAYGAPAFTGLFGKYGSAIDISVPVVLFSFALPLLATVLFGLAPALRATRSAALPGLQSGATQLTAARTSRRLGHVLLAAEMAATIALLSTAGLLVRSLRNTMSYTSGFDPHHTLTANLQLTGTRYSSPADLNRFGNGLLARLDNLPGVSAAAITDVLPVENTAKLPFSLDGASTPALDPGHLVAFLTISPGYFRAMGTPLLRGRDLAAGDTFTSPRILIVNRALATRFFGGNALGRHLYIRDINTRDPRFVMATVVGVAENVPHNGLLQPVEPEIYLPFAQFPQPAFEVAIRSTLDPSLLRAFLIKAAADADPDVPLTAIETVDDRVAHNVILRKAIMTLMLAFAVLAMMVSAIAVGGMFAYMVAQRTREMGIRLALGASRAPLLRIILAEVWTILNFGTLFGLIASFVSSRAVASMLVGIGQHDPAVNAAALALMATVAVAAALLPAIRASRADALAVLRVD